MDGFGGAVKISKDDNNDDEEGREHMNAREARKMVEAKT